MFRAATAFLDNGPSADVGEGRHRLRDRKRSTCEIEFEGPLADFRPVRESLQTALRSASDSHTGLGLAFACADGLQVDGKPADDLVESLTRAGCWRRCGCG